MDVDDDWENFCKGEYKIGDNKTEQTDCSAPPCGDLYISTITKLAYLNSKSPLNPYFGKFQ